MSQHRCLTLLTDFGLSDGYVGMMKGTIARINPHLTVIDLTHQVPPQNIAHARFVLMTSYPYFPASTVHVVVVDPGVGSQRRAIAIAFGKDPDHPTGFLVGPDNGVLSGVFQQEAIIAVVELTNPKFWLAPNPSTTFHGRDIFAPVAAHLASGVALEELGREIEPASLVSLDTPAIKTELLSDSVVKLTGHIQAIDHFGNLITTIPAEQVFGKKWSVLIGDIDLPGKQTYSEVTPGDLLALIGSHGWVEVAVNSGNAQEKLKLHWGKEIQIIRER